MKILTITNLYPPYFLGGYELLCETVADELGNRNHEVRILTSDWKNDGANGRPVKANVYRHLKLYVPFGRTAGSMRGRKLATGYRNAIVTRKHIQEFQPDLIFIWSQLRLTLGASQIAEQSGIPTAYTFNDNHVLGYLPVEVNGSIKKKILNKIETRIPGQLTTQGMKFSNATCISQTLKSELVDKGLPIQNSRVIYQGIKPEDFRPKSEPGKINRPLKLLYAGQLHSYKGVHTAIKAAHKLAANFQYSDLKLSIVGDGDRKYVNQLASLAVAGPARIEFDGRIAREELADYYRRHDILLFPSIWKEPFGLTHLEAMACGTPVISTTEGGPGEFLIDGKNALTFEKNNADQLAAQIKRLASCKTLGRNLAGQALEMIENRFCLSRYTDELEEFLRESKERYR